MSRIYPWLIPLLGLGLLWVVLAQADWPAVAVGLSTIGLAWVLLVLGIHAVSFLADTMLWVMAYDALQPTVRWCGRLYAVRLIGEAFNNATPFASLGGEPVKALLLKQHYQISYADSAVAFMLSKTANLIALVVFLAVGFAAMLQDPRLADGYQALAGGGLLAFALAIIFLFGVQHLGLATRISRRIANTRFAARLQGPLAAAERFDAQLVGCYRRAPRRFISMLGLALITWLAGIFEIWVLAYALGHDMTLLDAWVVEALAQLVRSAAFFVPSGIGVVDATLVVVIGATTGSATTGIVIAIARRVRDVIWIAIGFLLSVPFRASSLTERVVADGEPRSQ